MAVVRGRATWEAVPPGALPGDPLVIVTTGPSRGVKMRRSQAIKAGYDVPEVEEPVEPAADQEPEEPAEEPKKRASKDKRRKPEGDK